MSTSSFCLFEILQVIETWLEFTLFYLVNDFYHLVVHRGRTTHFSAILRYGSIDSIHFGKFSLFQILKHACLKFGMFADGDRDDEERESSFQGIAIIEQFDNVLSLNRFDTDTPFFAYIDTFLDQRLHDSARILRTCCFAEGTSKDSTHT